MFSHNSKGLRPGSLPYRRIARNADVLRNRADLHDCVRDLISPMTAVKKFVNVIIDVANGRYDR